MKILREVDETEVLDHWKQVEGFSSDDFRTDIRDPLPNDMNWYIAEIESEDIENIFIISSTDWLNVSPTYRLAEVVDTLSSGKIDEKIPNILEKRELYRKNIDSLDRLFIYVAPNLNGNYTIIEGNKRSVALQDLNLLVRNKIYLGLSEGISGYWWARHTPN